MNLTEKHLKQLEALLREGSDFMNKFHPKYRPRDRDEGYFNLVMHSRLLKQDDKYRDWHKRIVNMLSKSIGSDFYAARFEKTAYPSAYTLSAPDGYYWGVRSLEAIILELRKIYYANTNGALLEDQSKKHPAHFEYRDPHILLVIDETHDRYKIHTFRSGSPKAIFEFALNNPNRTALKSHFRSTRGISKDNFKDIFRHFIENENLQTAKILRYLVIDNNKLYINEDSFILTTNDVRKVHQIFKKFG